MNIQQLHEHYRSSSGACTDSRNIFEGCLFFALKGDNFNGNKFAREALDKGASFAVIDEEAYQVPGRTLLVDDVLSSLQDLGRYHRRQMSARIIGLTGSNGKTTSKELLRQVLEQKYRVIATSGNLNNHIGVPLTLLRLKEDTEIGIIEMGANHQGEIAFLSGIAEPEMGFITNFGKAHLEGFGGVEGVIKGKSELYNFLMQRDHPIFFNGDDPIMQEKLQGYTRKFAYSREKDECYTIELLESTPYVRIKADDTIISTQLSGSYNYQNCAIALMIGKYLNVPLEQIKAGLESYLPSNNRSQWVTAGQHKVLMDAYNANPSSMEQALKNFANIESRPKIVILGDMFELGEDADKEHQAIADLASSLGFDEVYLVGENFFKTKGTNQRFRDFQSLEKALVETTIPGSTMMIKGSRGMALERVLPLLTGTVDSGN